jgi:hypothetical protein
MMDAEPVTAPAPAGAAGDDERAAEQLLARLAAARVMLGDRMAPGITVIVRMTVMTTAGVALRTLDVPRWPVIAGACMLVAALALALPALSVAGGREEPEWARAASIHQQSVAPRMVPAATMQIIQRCLAGLPGRRWRGAYLYIPRCTDPEPGHFGVCHAGGVYPMDGRLLLILGEHLVTGPSRVMAGTLGHESRHVTRWRVRLSYLAFVCGVWGWVIIGWAVPWPVLLPAVIGLRVVLTAAGWVVEATCDLGGARTAGAEAMLDFLAYGRGVKSAARAGRPAWKRRTLSVLTWLAGPSHPPMPLRRALIRGYRERKG